MTRDDEPELTPGERDAFAALPRDRVPPPHLEERVVGALRAERLLGRRGRPPRAWLAAAVAAGIALFAAGTATGQWMAARSTERVVAAVRDGDAATRAARVQETGSAYVQAVARLADLAESGDRAAADPGTEAARAALHAAVLELARLRPDDPTVVLLLAALEAGRQQAGDAGARVRTTMWF